jgi:hypothetical protein
MKMSTSLIFAKSILVLKFHDSVFHNITGESAADLKNSIFEAAWVDMKSNCGFEVSNINITSSSSTVINLRKIK